MILNTYLNSNYNNCKTLFLFSFLFSENKNSEIIPNKHLVSNTDHSLLISKTKGLVFSFGFSNVTKDNMPSQVHLNLLY